MQVERPKHTCLMLAYSVGQSASLERLKHRCYKRAGWWPMMYASVEHSGFFLRFNSLATTYTIVQQHVAWVSVITFEFWPCMTLTTQLTSFNMRCPMPQPNRLYWLIACYKYHKCNYCKSHCSCPMFPWTINLIFSREVPDCPNMSGVWLHYGHRLDE